MDLKIAVFGYPDEMVCGTCEGGSCSHCSSTEREKLSTLLIRFRSLLDSSEYSGIASVDFFEPDDSNLQKYPDVDKLLSIASLTPLVTINGKVSYLGGFSPDGLLSELRKKHPLN